MIENLFRFVLYAIFFSFMLTLSFGYTAQAAFPQQADSSSFFLKADSPYSHFLHRMDEDSTPSRVFALGVFTNLLHPQYFQEYDPRHNRIPDDELFETLTKHFNLIYAPFTYVSGEIRRPAFYDSLGPDQAFVMGAGHLPWWLRTKYGVERTDRLTRTDQETLAARLNRENLRQPIRELVRFAGESNLIINLADEPERGGYGGSWFYTNETLRTLYELAGEHGLVSLGLGPVGNARGRGVGNKLTWSIQYPRSLFSNPSARRIRQTNMNWKQILNTMLNYYEGTFDIVYLNSYAFTITDNRRMGQIVREMLHHPTINRKKPVWPWISVENFRHPDPERGYQQIRRQAFSAIANEASGLMFYPDTRVDENSTEQDETLWHLSLELLREIGRWRHVLETGDFINNYISRNLEWIQYNYEDYEVIFLVNHGHNAITCTTAGPLNADAGESGIWYRKMGEVKFRRD